MCVLFSKTPPDTEIPVKMPIKRYSRIRSCMDHKGR